MTKFYIVDLPLYCVIFGAYWLSTHNPTIDFSSRTLQFKSNYCIKNCLIIPNTFTTFINSTSSEINISQENKIMENNYDKETTEIKNQLPSKLLEFKDVFIEVSANKLPPHRPYDCEINIKPDSNLYYGPIYPLTNKELIALKKYIDEMLSKGFIRKSKSPAGVPIFFVLKKTVNSDLLLIIADLTRLPSAIHSQFH